MITDSDVFIERAERFLNIAYNASEKFVAQRSREETNANALIAIALELQAIRKVMEQVRSDNTLTLDDMLPWNPVNSQER